MINCFYDLIKECIEDAGLLPTEVWNLNESGFPTDPDKAKVIAPRRIVANKVTYGADRKNITTLAVSSVSGQMLDPLIILSGVNFQLNSRSKKPLKNLCYGIFKKVWMTTEISHSWFEKFCQQVG